MPNKKICKHCGVETISNEEDNCYKNPNKKASIIEDAKFKLYKSANEHHEYGAWYYAEDAARYINTVEEQFKQLKK